MPSFGVVVLGQSICAFSSGPAHYSVKSPNLFMLDPSTGAISPAVEPFPGATGPDSSYVTELFDTLSLTEPRFAGTKIVVADICQGGSWAWQWAAGGSFNALIGQTVAKFNAAGIPVSLIIYDQGVTDATYSTPPPTYTTQVESTEQTFRRLGVTAPFLVALETFNNGFPQPGTPIVRAAQQALPDGRRRFQGADFDQLGNGDMRTDTPHPNTRGEHFEALMWKLAIDRYFATH